MGFLKRLFGGGPGSGAESTAGGGEVMDPHGDGRLVAGEATFDAWADRQRATIWLRLDDPDFESPREQQRVFALEDRVMRALDASGAGEHDTNSIEPGFFVMRLVGDDAAAIAAVVSPLLADAAPGSYLALRRGPAGSGEERADVGRASHPADGA